MTYGRSFIPWQADKATKMRRHEEVPRDVWPQPNPRRALARRL